MRIATNCVGQHLVMGRLPRGAQATLAGLGWQWSYSDKTLTRGMFWADDTELAKRTAHRFSVPFDATPKLRETR